MKDKKLLFHKKKKNLLENKNQSDKKPTRLRLFIKDKSIRHQMTSSHFFFFFIFNFILFQYLVSTKTASSTSVSAS